LAVPDRLGLQSGRTDATAPRGGDVLTGAWRFRTRRRRSTRYYQTYFSHKLPKLWGDLKPRYPVRNESLEVHVAGWRKIR